MTITPAMTDTDTDQLESLRSRLEAEGYEGVAEHHALKAGARIRHSSHRYPEAYLHGSGTVLAVFSKNPSSWASIYGQPDVEVIVLLDRPGIGGTRLMQCASYHAHTVEEG